MSDETKLLPCPFCGSSAIDYEYGENHRWMLVQCADCRATLQLGKADRSRIPTDSINTQGAIAAWNRRAFPDIDDATVEEMLVAYQRDMHRQMDGKSTLVNRLSCMRAAIAVLRKKPTQETTP